MHLCPVPPPILQTKHKHSYKLHKICQFDHFIFEKIIKIVATRSISLGTSQRSPINLSWILVVLTERRKGEERRTEERKRGVKGGRAGRAGTKGRSGRERKTRPPN